MLSPSDRVVFLPQDREIMDITGLSEQQYRWFVRECYKNCKLRPGEPVALEPLTLALINIAIGILLTAASMLLAPKPKDQEAATLTEETVEGQNVVRRDRFAPKSGFDSFQNVVDMGSVVPIVYAKAETFDAEGRQPGDDDYDETTAQQYGGIRINTNLLWSQVLSVGGGQFFKGLFLIGEGGVELDYEQIALGNNTLASYELERGVEAGRVTLYFTDDGGRINAEYDEDDETVGDYKLGVVPDRDPGALAGGPDDVYSFTGQDGNGDPLAIKNFCQALQPSNQVEFGVYGHIGNNFGYKLGEDFTPLTQWQGGDDAFQRQNSTQAVAEAKRSAVIFTTRAGFVGNTSQERDVEVGDELTYRIYPSSDIDREFELNNTGGGGQPDNVVTCENVATAVASIQRTFDERISVGALYRAGSAVVVCTNRTGPFVSSVDFEGDDGTEMTATFRVVEAGTVREYTENELNRTNFAETDYAAGKICSAEAQLFQLLVGSFSVERACRKIEVGLQSNVGLKSGGITNFNSLVTRRQYESGLDQVLDFSYQAYVDAEYCGGQADGITEENSYRTEVKAGTYSASDTRYSFFRISYRDIDATDFTVLSNLFAVRSSTGVDTYNFLRFIFADAKRREFRFTPVSSWEVRTNKYEGVLYAIDAHGDTDTLARAVYTDLSLVIEFVGFEIDDPGLAFSVRAFLPADPDIQPNCETEERIRDVLIANRGSGYSTQGGVSFGDAPGVFFQNWRGIRMRSLDNPSRILEDTTVSIREDRAGGQPGEVNNIFLEDDNFNTIRPLNEQGFTQGERMEIIPGQIAGSGFIGTIDLFTRTICEEVEDGAGRLGISPFDDPAAISYVDGYARIAEAFIYDGVSTTASEPEHKISYVNIISENTEDPEYDLMSLIGLNVRSSKELRALDQLSVYCTRGSIDSHLFPDVLEDLLTNPRYGTGEFFSAEMIDDGSFEAAAAWTNERRYYFDGAISEKLNLRQWGAERARDFLLDLSVSGGRFTLTPALRFDEPEPVVGLFTSGNILEGSFQCNYFDLQDRMPPIVSVRWREERANNTPNDKGLFPLMREFNVRYAGTDENAPVIQVDMSNFCTNRQHALDRAKLECIMKQHVTHAVSFKTLPSQSGVQAGSVIKVGIETVNYDQPRNGAISSNGTVTSWPELGDGLHQVLLWNGEAMQEVEIEITNGKVGEGDYFNSVFCVQSGVQSAETYKVTAVSFDEEGNVDIEAMYWPTDENGVSLLTIEWDDSYWTVDG